VLTRATARAVAGDCEHHRRSPLPPGEHPDRGGRGVQRTAPGRLGGDVTAGDRSGEYATSSGSATRRRQREASAWRSTRTGTAELHLVRPGLDNADRRLYSPGRQPHPDRIVGGLDGHDAGLDREARELWKFRRRLTKIELKQETATCSHNRTSVFSIRTIWDRD
jgi:hypothetical protein